MIPTRLKRAIQALSEQNIQEAAIFTFVRHHPDTLRSRARIVWARPQGSAAAEKEGIVGTT